jgi:hypothetical protein
VEFLRRFEIMLSPHEHLPQVDSGLGYAFVLNRICGGGGLQEHRLP